jgi:pyruvate kinase
MHTQILCTLGPASMDPEVIKALDEKGVDLFRLNLSHTPLAKLEASIRFVQANTNKPLCLDTDGAQVRCGAMADGVVLEPGSTVALRPDPVLGSSSELTLRPRSVFQSLQPGHLVSVDFKGAFLRVTEVQVDHALAVVLEGGAVGSNRGVTIDPPPSMPALTDTDKEAVRIGRSLGARHVALSFARRAQDVTRLRTLAGPGSFVISKIETRAGVRNMDGIIAASDAVIIDRGDLSREIPLAHVPMHQKEIIRRANGANTPAFVATNLLESMVANRTPTIAEANDIINTLLDGAHGLVLAAETTIGRHPVETVEMIVNLIEAFEWTGERRLYPKKMSLRSREAAMSSPTSPTLLRKKGAAMQNGRPDEGKVSPKRTAAR